MLLIVRDRSLWRDMVVDYSLFEEVLFIYDVTDAMTAKRFACSHSACEPYLTLLSRSFWVPKAPTLKFEEYHHGLAVWHIFVTSRSRVHIISGHCYCLTSNS